MSEFSAASIFKKQNVNIITMKMMKEKTALIKQFTMQCSLLSFDNHLTKVNLSQLI